MKIKGQLFDVYVESEKIVLHRKFASGGIIWRKRFDLAQAQEMIEIMQKGINAMVYQPLTLPEMAKLEPSLADTQKHNIELAQKMTPGPVRMGTAHCKNCHNIWEYTARVEELIACPQCNTVGDGAYKKPKTIDRLTANLLANNTTCGTAKCNGCGRTWEYQCTIGHYLFCSGCDVMEFDTKVDATAGMSVEALENAKKNFEENEIGTEGKGMLGPTTIKERWELLKLTRAPKESVYDRVTTLESFIDWVVNEW